MNIVEGEQEVTQLLNTNKVNSGEATLRVASLFAGMGGFALAFKRSGFVSIWANELDKNAALTYRLNNPETLLIEGDIREFSPLRLGLEPPDVLTAGFPCQPFSLAGDRRGFEDERGTLYSEIVRILKEYGDDRPPILLLENVSNLLVFDRGQAYSKIENDLKAAGYWVLPYNVRRLNTRIHTDIPQNRERVFIIALSTKSFKGGRFNFPEPEPFTRPIQEFLDFSKRAEAHYYFDVENNRFGSMIMECVNQGNPQSIYQLRRSYVREHKNFVPALTANMGDGGHNVPTVLDPWGLRKLMPSECAALQGFVGPGAAFPPAVSKIHIYKQIGNSVTVPLVQKLADECRNLLQDETARRGSI
jgi:DNA (cytosine-5)-methyltransferase 1